MRLKRFANCFLLAMMLPFAAGCSLMQPAGFEKPELHLQNILVDQATLFQTGLVFTFRIDNANSEPLRVDGGSHRIYLNDVYVGKGLSSEQFTVPRFGSTETDVTVYINNLALISKIIPILESSALSYRVDSSLVREGALFGRRLRFSQSDTFELQRDFDTSKLRSLTANTF